MIRFTPRPLRLRTVTSLLLAGVVSAGLGGCTKPGPSTSDTPVRIGYSAWPGWFPWKVSEERGHFRAAGVPVSLTWFDGYLDSINALNAGQLDCNSQTLGDTISSVAAGADPVGAPIGPRAPPTAVGGAPPPGTEIATVVVTSASSQPGGLFVPGAFATGSSMYD